MAALTSGTALLIIVVFVVPGFIAVLVRERIYEVRGEDSSFDRLLTTMYYSLVVWAVPTVTAIVGGVHRGDVQTFVAGRAPLWLTACIAVCVLLVLPVVAAVMAWAWIRCRWRTALLEKLRLPRAHRFPSSWDFAFDSEQELLLVVGLRDGRRLAGFYGRRSHRGAGRRAGDLYLEARWDIDDDDVELLGPTPNNVGLWINAQDIVSVEQYALPNALPQPQEQEHEEG